MLNSFKNKKIITKIVWGLILLICVVSVALYQFERMTREESVGRIGQNTFPMMDYSFVNSDSVMQKIVIYSSENGTHEYKILLADTFALQQRGLGGRASLSDKEVMLFTFEKPDVHFFWMKDMLFSIDIVWLDSNKKVIHIEHQVTPQTYPKSFGPTVKSLYVLEFNADTAKSIDLRVGDIVEF